MNRLLVPALLVSCATAACVDDPSLSTTTQETGIGGGKGENGRWWLGGTADSLIGPSSNTELLAGALTGVTMDGVAVSLALVESKTAGPCLARAGQPCTTSVVDGAVFLGPSSGVPRLKIVSTARFPGLAGQTMTGYVMQHNAAWATGGVTWASYCKGDRLAYPVEGRIARSGTFVGGVEVSFACSEYTAAGLKPTTPGDLVGNGVAAKAMSWGFLPAGTYNTLDGRLVTGDSLYQLAVNAARADYCLDGVSHTIDGTSIMMADFVAGNVAATASSGPSPSPADAPVPIESHAEAYHLEALWVTGSKPAPTVLCMSKLRWQSLPLGDRCTNGQVLRDPRLPAMLVGDPPTAVPHGAYCEDLPSGVLGLAGAGATIAVESNWNDVGLWHWKNASTGDHYTTTVGNNAGSHPGGSTPPEAGYTTNALEPYGTILTSVGKEVFEANFAPAAGTFQELWSCKKGNDWLTTVPDEFPPPAGYVDCKLEGHVWKTPPGTPARAQLGWTMTTLYLYKKGTEYFTTTGSPYGYTLVATLGTIVAPATW